MLPGTSPAHPKDDFLDESVIKEAVSDWDAPDRNLRVESNGDGPELIGVQEWNFGSMKKQTCLGSVQKLL